MRATPVMQTFTAGCRKGWASWLGYAREAMQVELPGS
jgi:hypothetical protein